eukprot:COSAG06_NODE_825_length_12067_cov_4.396975_6_plen_47_part_00
MALAFGPVGVDRVHILLSEVVSTRIPFRWPWSKGQAGNDALCVIEV